MKTEHLVFGALAIAAAYYLWEQSQKDKTLDSAVVTPAPVPAVLPSPAPTTTPVTGVVAFASADGHIFKDYVSADFFKSQPQKLTH